MVGAVYGAPGSGKTTFLSDAADSEHGIPMLVADAEGGARAFAHRDDIDVASFVDPDADGSGWSDFDDFVNDLIMGRKGLDKYKTIVVDNVSELLSLCIRWVVKNISRGQGVTANDRPDQRDWNLVTQRMLIMIRKLRDYGRASGTNIFFIAWEAPEKDEQTGITKADVAFNPALARQFPGILDFVGYLTVVNATTRRLSFEASRTTAAKFRKSRMDAAQKIPGRFEYKIDDKPLVDILAVMKGGASWPSEKYAKNVSAAPSATQSNATSK